MWHSAALGRNQVLRRVARRAVAQSYSCSLSRRTAEHEYEYATPPVLAEECAMKIVRIQKKTRAKRRSPVPPTGAAFVDRKKDAAKRACRRARLPGLLDT